MPDDPTLSVHLNLLSETERLRAERYKSDKDRNEYILRWGTLRLLVAAYLDIPPEHVAFTLLRHGKPSLYLPSPSGSLHFNTSCSEGLAVFAFARTEIGIDIEKLRAGVECLEIAEQYFSEYERMQLHNLKGTDLHKAFFRCWTRKEAYVKAKGGGLSMSLKDFDVPVSDIECVALVATRPDPAEAIRWILRDLSIWPGYAGALAISRD